MHDTLISKDIIETAKKEGNVKEIVVEVGDLGHLPAQELHATLKKMVPDWKVNIKRRKALCRCACGFSGHPTIIEHTHGHSVYECPKCGNVPDITEGDQIVLKEVVIE